MFDSVCISKSCICRGCIFPSERYAFRSKIHGFPITVNPLFQYQPWFFVCQLAIIPYLKSVDLFRPYVCNFEIQYSIFTFSGRFNFTYAVSVRTGFFYAVCEWFTVNLNRQTTDYCIPNITACIFFPRNCFTGICLLKFRVSGCRFADNLYLQSL